ncbi:hypothetical protein [Leifsonia kafniensis]|uniref:hypothetical protein n=1 Tax=Leifsonia kafniensis TaxID=475957 RepID=UPI0031EABFB7
MRHHPVLLRSSRVPRPSRRDSAAVLGLAWIAAGMLFTIIGSMLDAWVLMVEILR